MIDRTVQRINNSGSTLFRSLSCPNFTSGSGPAQSAINEFGNEPLQFHSFVPGEGSCQSQLMDLRHSERLNSHAGQHSV